MGFSPYRNHWEHNKTGEITKTILEEIKADIDEGADWVMVKPAHSYDDLENTLSKIIKK